MLKAFSFAILLTVIGGHYLSLLFISDCTLIMWRNVRQVASFLKKRGLNFTIFPCFNKEEFLSLSKEEYLQIIFKLSEVIKLNPLQLLTFYCWQTKCRDQSRNIVSVVEILRTINVHIWSYHSLLTKNQQERQRCNVTNNGYCVRSIETDWLLCKQTDFTVECRWQNLIGKCRTRAKLMSRLVNPPSRAMKVLLFFFSSIFLASEN